MKKKIIANFKMNMTTSEIKNYIMSLSSKFYEDKVDIKLALPFVSLPLGNYLLQETNISVVAQNLSDEEKCSVTGEISGKMLKDINVKNVIVGHGERRVKFKESNKTINKKIKLALKNGLQVILCVGESLIERNSLKFQNSISSQLDECLKGLYENELENIIIAYEPVWAIGSGKNATVKEIEEGIKAIRNSIEHSFSKKASEDVCVIYGGSVNAKNINQFIACKGLDGVMVGSACLDVASLLHIISVCENSSKK